MASWDDIQDWACPWLGAFGKKERESFSTFAIMPPIIMDKIKIGLLRTLIIWTM